MRDGRTREIDHAEGDPGFASFLDRWRVSVVLASGPAAGSEYPIEGPITFFGRGPGVTLAFDDDAMSREHAALEYVEGGLRIRDLGSTNGLSVNGSPVRLAELKSGDRFELGEHVFEIVLEERPREPRTYVIAEA